MTDPHPPTHDWHVGTDGMELLIRRDEADSVGVHVGHENIDDAHATTIITSRLLEMIDAVQPGAVRDHLREQEPTDAEVEAAAHALHEDMGGMPDEFEHMHIEAARAALTAARAVGRDAR